MLTQLPSLPTMGVFVVILIVVAIVLARHAKKNPGVINYPISADGPKRGNENGEFIKKTICPICRDSDGFYEGEVPGLVYCGNRHCRCGWQVFNYGNGVVWAERSGSASKFIYR